jgi:membrane-bound lytic murein transglycosylase D
MGGYNERASFQGTNYYYDLVLPDETSRYIFRILAFKHLLSNADSLGFKLPAGTAYEPVKTKKMLVTQSIPNLAAYARSNGTNLKILKWLNPWLRGKSLSVKGGKSYELLLPAE